jgi:hypothetical protein
MRELRSEFSWNGHPTPDCQRTITVRAEQVPGDMHQTSWEEEYRKSNPSQPAEVVPHEPAAIAVSVKDLERAGWSPID